MAKENSVKVEQKPGNTPNTPNGPQQSQPKPTGSSKKGFEPLPGGCGGWYCKYKAERFGFCPEHYEQFKFGLIKKTGEPVPDFEKKFEHYRAYKARKDAPKAA